MPRTARARREDLRLRARSGGRRGQDDQAQADGVEVLFDLVHGLSPPPGLDHGVGQEEPEEGEAEVIDEVGRVQDALGHVVEVLEEGDVVEDVLPERRRPSWRPS